MKDTTSTEGVFYSTRSSDPFRSEASESDVLQTAVTEQTEDSANDKRPSASTSLESSSTVVEDQLTTNGPPESTTRYEDNTSYGFRTPDLNKNLLESGFASGTPQSMHFGLKSADDVTYPKCGVHYTKSSYPAWSSTDKHQVPIDVSEIALIFGNLRRTFGFQRDNMLNIFDYLMTQLDSRSSRMGPELALLTIHADYIGGDNSNFRKWYFASGLARMDEEIEKNSNHWTSTMPPRDPEKGEGSEDSSSTKAPVFTPTSSDLDYGYRRKMNAMDSRQRIIQVAIYLLSWGEANQVRFMPECLAFIVKTMIDYYYDISKDECFVSDAKDGDFLKHVITPLYDFYVRQKYETNEHGKMVQKELDHKDIIGYDDMNQLFWHYKDLERIQLKNCEKLVSFAPWKQYHYLQDVDWDKAFYKTYRETRSWLHLVLNFNRIWILHLAIFWFYTAPNVPSLYTVDYKYTKNNQPPAHIRWTVVALGGAFGPLINIVATICELVFVPRRWPSAHSVWPRLLVFFVNLVVNIGPTVYIWLFLPLDKPHVYGTVLSISQLVVSIFTTIVYSFVPLGSMLRHKKSNSSAVFTSSFCSLSGNDRFISYGLWICIFAAKLTESYFFLTLSLRDPIRELSILSPDFCIGAQYIGEFLCFQQPKIILVLMILADLVLFFLDTYLWYVIFNTLFSVLRSFYLGASIWTPWRNIYCRLPKRMFSKVLFTRNTSTADNAKYLVSQIWNAIVVSMYREHLIPLEKVQKLVYIQERPSDSDEKVLYEPAFFVSQEDTSFHTSIFNGQHEAERRISFFAQSLSTPIPEPVPVEAMPTFTVLVPHYGEKMVLSLRETIREQDKDSKITLLEYLKNLHPLEWACYVKDSMGLAKESDIPKEFQDSNDPSPAEKPDTLPFYCVGFKSSSPEYILRTRLWASLRTQTLYRTISGFMNYPRAIKLMYSVETMDHLNALKGGNEKDSMDPKAQKQVVEENLTQIARRKFRLLAAVQRLKSFDDEEIKDKEMMLRAYPELNIAYLDYETDENGTKVYYSCLVDGECEIMDNGQRKPKYKIRLSGNPILGDGKSDNQNHAIIFQRGEYIQLIDANQDNYLEECLKIRSVLAEFEEMDLPQHPYSHQQLSKNNGYTPPRKPPVAILGAREYIFSENIGVLGDIAAGKEQTFGTLFARTLSKIGGKLHYGHPDFLNAIFMTTRGGVSKAQKGLHLNEDIFAGMTALQRGGRIKHCEYMQCGKGRDLGFGSILNFTTKIGSGMGEQMLSREYYYLGSMLPLDRFLSFYYAHAGFHINNLFIVISLESFLLVLLYIAALARESVLCKFNKNAPITDVHEPPGCQNLIPVFNWVTRCVLSIFIVFFISFLPLSVQEFTERGFLRAITRLGKHFASLSPLFEVFVCQIYAQSLSEDLNIGGARYISTGRGFATTRIPFTALYQRFGSTSIYFGAKLLLILVFVSSTLWSVSLLWFWVTTVALCQAPYLFNPHQFSIVDFFLDYRMFIKWLTRGNDRYNQNSWVAYNRSNRSRITGIKATRNEDFDQPGDKFIKKPSTASNLFHEVLGSLFNAVMIIIPYLYVNSQSNLQGTGPTNPILRLAIVSLGPIICNFVALIFSFVFAITFCCTVARKWGTPPSTMAALMHAVAIVNHFMFFEIMWMLESWNFPHALLGYIASMTVQSFIFRCAQTIGLSREYRNGESNVLFWNGKWLEAKLRWHTVSQPVREILCKTMEMSMFAMDFVLGHFLLFAQTPILFVPLINRFHTMMLFWVSPKNTMKTQPLTKTKRKARMRLVPKYVCLYIMVMLTIIGFGVAPLFIPRGLKTALSNFVDSIAPGLVQPPMRSLKSTGIAPKHT